MTNARVADALAGAVEPDRELVDPGELGSTAKPPQAAGARWWSLFASSP